jgi:glycosyltransferase involved in cell wall biosynthesis
MKPISIVIPVLNNPATAEILFDRLYKLFGQSGRMVELIFVDDHSKDNTPEVIRRLAQQYPEQILYCLLNKNKGQHFATLTGMMLSTGDPVVTIDDDLQYAPENITDLLQMLEKHPESIVYGIPVRKKGVSRFRRFAAELLHRTAVFAGMKKEKFSSFRCMSRTTADVLVKNARHYVNIEHISIEKKIHHQGINVPHFPGCRRKSRYTLIKLFLFVIKSLITYTTFSFVLLAMVFATVVVSLFFLHPASIIVTGTILSISILLCVLILSVRHYFRKPVKFNKHILEKKQS